MRHIDIDIYDIIPQRPPMVMIDNLLSCDQTMTETDFVIKDDCIFVSRDRLTAEGMLENIAQTCAARIGYLNTLEGNAVKLGFIGAVKDFHAIELPEVGNRIVTSVIVKEEIFGITLVDAFISLNGNKIAQTTMKIALSDIDAQK